MNYSLLSDAQISQRVGAIISRDQLSVIGANGKAFIHHYGAPVGDYGSLCLGWVEFDPCNSWADAGPIIQHNSIGIMPFKNYESEAWQLSAGLLSNTTVKDKSPLRAAMIVFLMMQEEK